MKKLLIDHPWVIALILILVVNLPAAILLTYAITRQDNVVECISNWADETSERSSKLDIAEDVRSAALDELVRSVATQDQKIFTDKFNMYIAASDAFNQVQKDNPVPESPRLVC